MKIIILGCGRAGSITARMLSEAGHDVTIIDFNADAFRRLGNLPEVTEVVGSGIDLDVLRRAGIENADVFIAVTNGDNTNIMSTQIAKNEFGVARCVARMYDPSRAQAYREMGIQTLCTPLLAAGLLRDYVLEQEWGKITDYIEPLLPEGEGA
ncbi:MAG: TrkA family potassium uptake protein [Armatimonadetes bacterium]|nr:TrkA family potassium uptake protein [Armatimonadota bacterium]